MAPLNPCKMATTHFLLISSLRVRKMASIVAIVSPLAFNLSSPSLCQKNNKNDEENSSKSIINWNSKIEDFVGKENAERMKKLFGIDKDADIGKELDRILHYSGNASQYGYGFVMGYMSGFAMKKVSRVVAFVFGGIFVGVQALSYSGYLSVNYEKLQKDAEKLLALDQKNGNGKLDSKDLSALREKITDVVAYNMPSGSSFTVGLLLGLRS